MKIKFIINPVSGTGKQKNIEQYIHKYCKYDFTISYTKEKNDASIISNKAIKEKYDAVIAVGGDGTVNECAKSLINSNTSLGVIPCGSGNGFAYHIGMSTNIKKAIIQLEKSKEELIDTCSVNDKKFINVSGIGFDAHIAHIFSNFKKRGFINYIKIVLRELNYSPKKYTISYNNITRSVNAFFISFANASQYGNNAKISPLAKINDGLIDFVIVKKFPKWKIPIFIYYLMKGKLHQTKFIEIVRSDNIKIDSDDNFIHLDGEPVIIKDKLHIKLLKNSLKILIPKNEKK